MSRTRTIGAAGDCARQEAGRGVDTRAGRFENDRNSFENRPHAEKEHAVTQVPVLDRSTRAELAKAARREEILAAARRVFAARGFRGTTIADIADEAHIALGTIYLYFPSKDAVFGALSDQLHALIAATIANVPAERSIDRTVRRRVEDIFAVCADNRDLVRLVFLNTDPDSDVAHRMRRASDARERPMMAEIANGIAAGALRAGSAAIIARLTVGAVAVALYQAFVLSNGEDAEKYAGACADMITAYLRPQA
jgi:AcrR family transcriptional regulator